MNIYEKLMGIQQELKAPKGNFNNFGKYKYRSAEDILEAVKPLLAKYKTVLLINDEVVMIEGKTYTESEGNKSENEGRYYVEATVTLIDVEKGEKVSSRALAREEESKKGMDGSQVTGGASSYARKYALNGLFAIDDTKDSDYTNTSQNKQQIAGRQQLSALQQATNNLYATVQAKKITAEQMTQLITDRYKKKSSKELSLQEVQDLQKFIAVFEHKNLLKNKQEDNEEIIEPDFEETEEEIKHQESISYEGLYINDDELRLK